MSARESAPPRVGDDLTIGRQLHDIVVPQLFVLTTGLTALRRRRGAGSNDPLVADLVETATQALSDLRAISRGEHTDSPDSLRKVAARLESETKPVEKLTECALVFECEGDAAVSPAFGVDLAAFVWEAIANALRHGGAGHMVVSFLADDDQITVVAQDDGCWQPPTDVWGSGVPGLEARAARWGGHVDVAGSSEGTRLELRVPRAGVAQGRACR